MVLVTTGLPRDRESFNCRLAHLLHAFVEPLNCAKLLLLVLLDTDYSIKAKWRLKYVVQTNKINNII